MGKKSLTINSTMNTVKTLMSLIFPLITYPYALRVLGVENIGRANFANSIVSYFVLLAGLGINRYAIREGARIRECSEEFKTFANQMFTINVVSTTISYVLLICVLLFSTKIRGYSSLVLVYSLTIIGTTIGVDWINSAQEEYVYITIRTIALQFISMILLFAVVRNEDDLVPYALVSVFANVGANICNFFYVRKYAKVKLHFKGLKKHIAPVMWLFASAIATTIYVNSDTTMLGIFCSDYNVGIYGVATKIYTIMKQILAAAIVVTLPRLSNYYAKGLRNEFNKTASNVFDIFTTLLFPIVTGLFLLAPQAIVIIGGEEYIEGINSLRILSISLCFSIFGTFYTNCILLPMKKEKEVTAIMVTSAVVNFSLNLVLIPILEQDGAALTTAIAEACVMLLQIHVVKSENIINIKLKKMVQVFSGCIIMGITVLIISRCFSNVLVSAAVSSIVGAIVYFLVLLLEKNECILLVKCKIVRKLKL